MSVPMDIVFGELEDCFKDFKGEFKQKHIAFIEETLGFKVLERGSKFFTFLYSERIYKLSSFEEKKKKGKTCIMWQVTCESLDDLYWTERDEDILFVLFKFVEYYPSNL